MARRPRPDQLDPERFTSAVYQQVVAGMPRLAGARAALEFFGVPDLDGRAERYAAVKQERVVRLIREGRFMAFPDALRCILAVKDRGIRVAAASSSKNAKLFLERIRLDTFAAEQRLDYEFVHEGMTLDQLFDADISGRDLPRGKPDPMIFLTAAEELGLPPDACFVIEDAASGVQAAKAGGMAAIGVARHGDQDLLVGAGADLVVTTLDDVSMPALAEGRLQELRAVEEVRRRHTERPPDVWTLVYDGFDPRARGFARRSARWGTGTSSPEAPCPRPRPTGSTTRAPMSPACTTGWSATSPGVRSRTRTWSTSPTGCRCGSGSPAVPGSTSGSPVSKITASSWTCGSGRSPVG